MQRMPAWLYSVFNTATMFAAPAPSCTMSSAPYMPHNRNGKPSGAAAAKRAAKKRRNIAKHN